MRTKTAAVPLLITLLFWGTTLAAEQLEEQGVQTLAQAALTGNSAAIAGLREAGTAGMEAMLALGASGDALDQVCGVRDCASIRLFWYTDLEAAKVAARAAGKPILSLR